MECPSCDGSGELEYSCENCSGSGKGMAEGSSCWSCKGHGSTGVLDCGECKGKGRVLCCDCGEDRENMKWTKHGYQCGACEALEMEEA